ncbi:phosphotransferase [Kribbella sp.]|uniref:phosphotransferase n=1 Tax=Kribbella sp. TaxID=1871183 RepID=UPI002D726F83|nr:phosphotransferase [Kribbella sp.]HZX04729.1 phosphotransferase [Kribbella sp.]
MEIGALVDRFGADRASVVHLGHSAATVVRLERSSERLYYKAGQGVGVEADRLAWLGAAGFPCPRIVDLGNNWMLTAELGGRDASQPWAAGDRPAVLAAIADGLRALDSLTGCPFRSPFPGSGDAVTHGDYAAPNVFVDPVTLRFSGVLDVSGLGTGDRYVDLALMVKSLRGGLNPQYGGLPAARRFVELYGGDPDDPRIEHYITLDDTYLP